MWNSRRWSFLGELIVMSAPELLVLACLLCAGCAGVIPLPKATHTAMGLNQQVSPDFVRAGQTTRAEVLEKLGTCDTGVKSRRFFVGRWISSRWAWFAIGQNSAAGDRHWSTTNLLIEFDENDVAKRVEKFSDKELARELGPITEESKPLETADPIELGIASSLWRPYPERLVLANGLIEFHGVGSRKKPRDFTIAASKVSSVSSVAIKGADPMYATQVIRFSEELDPLGGPKGKKIYVRLTVPDLVTLLSYVHRYSQER